MFGYGFRIKARPSIGLNNLLFGMLEISEKGVRLNASISCCSAASPAAQDSGWADGLRGIAALFVVSSHLVLCFTRSLVAPCCGSVPGQPSLWQLPVLRLIAQGHSWVAMFCVLSGFVNALKPIRLARTDQADAAVRNLAPASFRRTFRLMLPAGFATVVSWSVCQLGLYELARRADGWWLYVNTPKPSATWVAAVGDLLVNLRNTWTMNDFNIYDQPQWALVYLLQGSMMTFCALLVTLNLRPLWRTVLLGIFAIWSFDWSKSIGDPLIGMTFFGGIMLAEFSLSDLVQSLTPLSPILSPPLALLALVLMSFPTDRADTMPWSRWLQVQGESLFPAGIDLARAWGSAGSMMLVAAIIISPRLRMLLGRPWLRWLGRVSFPIYLLHATFMRTAMAWLVFAGQPLVPFEEAGPPAADGAPTTMVIERYAQPGPARTWAGIVVGMGAMLLASHWWTAKLEPEFGRITKLAEDLMMKKRGGADAATSAESAPQPGLLEGRPRTASHRGESHRGEPSEGTLTPKPVTSEVCEGLHRSPSALSIRSPSSRSAVSILPV